MDTKLRAVDAAPENGVSAAVPGGETRMSNIATKIEKCFIQIALKFQSFEARYECHAAIAVHTLGAQAV